MVLLDNGGRAEGECRLLAAPEGLTHFVEHLWIQDGAHTAPDWRVVADTSPHLVAAVTKQPGGRRIRVVLVGARSSAADIDVSRRVLTVGIRLRPGTLPALIDLAARELTNDSMPIESAFRASLLQNLQLGPDAPAGLLIRELIDLVRRGARGRAPSRALPEAAAVATRVTEMARRLHSPARSLRDAALRDVGLGPKRILRIIRLHAALRAARASGASWSQIAAATGYSDQAHLTRELRALLGETPVAWAARGNAMSSMAAVSYKTRPDEAR